jgi:hypothetical protein
MRRKGSAAELCTCGTSKSEVGATVAPWGIVKFSDNWLAQDVEPFVRFEDTNILTPSGDKMGPQLADFSTTNLPLIDTSFFTKFSGKFTGRPFSNAALS